MDDLTARTARQAIARERETRHWTIPQWRDDSPDEWNWPAWSAKTQREADEAVDWFVEALDTLRGAWNAHMDECTHPSLVISLFEDIDRWKNAPSNTASAIPNKENTAEALREFYATRGHAPIDTPEDHWAEARRLARWLLNWAPRVPNQPAQGCGCGVDHSADFLAPATLIELTLIEPKDEDDEYTRYRFMTCTACGGSLDPAAHPSWPRCEC